MWYLFSLVILSSHKPLAASLSWRRKEHTPKLSVLSMRKSRYHWLSIHQWLTAIVQFAAGKLWWNTSKDPTATGLEWKTISYKHLLHKLHTIHTYQGLFAFGILEYQWMPILKSILLFPTLHLSLSNSPHPIWSYLNAITFLILLPLWILNIWAVENMISTIIIRNLVLLLNVQSFSSQKKARN